MSQVFISYSHHDKEFVKQLMEKFDSKNVSYWYDKQTGTGHPWREEIDKQIEASYAMVVVISRESSKSRYVTYEWAYARGLDKRLFPIIIENDDVHPRLKDYQYLNFSKPDVAPWDKLFIDLESERKRYEIPENILELLNHRDNDVQNRSVAMIERISDPDKLDLLIEILNFQFSNRQNRKESHRAAIKAMGNIGFAAQGALLKALRSLDNDVRFLAAGELTQMPSDEVIEGLIAALDERSTVQFSALWVLGKVGGESEIDPVLPFLEEAETKSLAGKRLCDEAAKTLENIGTQRSLELAIAFWQTQVNVTEQHWRYGITIGDYARTKIEDLTARLNTLR